MQQSFGDLDYADCLSWLERQGNPLPKLKRLIPWESFRGDFKGLYKKERQEKRKGGRVPTDCIVMLKILVLQDMYKLSDDQAEYQVRDRLSFRDFLGLSVSDKVPDAKTIWLFRERLKDSGLLSGLFERMLSYVNAAEFRARKGQIVDASIVEVPRQRNSRDENVRIKSGEPPQEWPEAKRRQKDTQARWTKKHGRSRYGYKNHLSVDHQHKLIRSYQVTDASVHDSQVFEELLDPSNTRAEVWADSAYRSAKIEAYLTGAGYRSRIHRKGVRGKPLSARSKEANRKRSRHRARVEHVFAQQGERLVRTIGKARAAVKIGLQNLVYNMRRFVWLAG